MRNFFSKHDVGVKELLILGLILLGIYTVWLHRQFIGNTYVGVAQKVVDRLPQVNLIDRCGTDCQNQIDKRVQEALATASGKQTAPKGGGGVSSSTKTTYIPIGSTFSTRNADWTDVPGQVEVGVSDYGSSPNFYYDASVKIGNSTGQVAVRLFDTTNGIAVSLSELSSGSASYQNVSSPSLPLWAGKNTYKVQIKSTSGEEATFASGRIKVIYK